MKLLVTGNIGYITTEFIEEAFPECQILLLGETEQKSNRNKSLSVYPMPKTEEEFKDIFKTRVRVRASKKVPDTIKFLLNERRKTVLCKIEKNREPLDERNFGGGEDL